MHGLNRSRIGILSLTLCAYFTCAYVVEGTAADAPLSERVQAAKGTFTPITSAMLTQARGQLTLALGRLDKYLVKGGANGVAWKKYLLWDELAKQLKQPDTETDEQILHRVLHRYRLFHPGLEMPVFTDVAKALDIYISDSIAAKDGDAKVHFDTEVDHLASVLVEAEKNAAQGLSPAAAARMGEALGWLHDHRQLIALATAVRQQWSQPNMRLHLSKELISAGIARPLDETAPVRDVILGTQISGTGRTIGKLAIELIPNDKEAMLEAVLSGTNNAKTVGRNGPAIVWTQGQINLVGRKRLTIDPGGIKSTPAVASVQARTQVTGIGSTRRGIIDRIIRRVVCRKLPQQKGTSEQIAAQHARDLIAARLEREAGPMLSTANQQFAEKFRFPLLRRNEFPRLFQFSTTKEEMRLVILDDDESHLAATSAPPEILGKPDVSARFHESFVNNISYSMLAGETFDQDDIKELTVELLGQVPEQLQDEEGRDPWSITFDSDDPVTVRIVDDTVTVTVRGARYTSGTNVYDGMNVTVRYKFEKDAAGVVTARRQGELEIVPPGFVPGGGQRLSLRQVVLTDLLRRRFGKMFRETIISDGLELSGNWKKLGKLPLTQLTTARGWMALAWDIPSKTSSVAGKTDLPKGSVVRLEQK